MWNCIHVSLSDSFALLFLGKYLPRKEMPNRLWQFWIIDNIRNCHMTRFLPGSFLRTRCVVPTCLTVVVPPSAVTRVTICWSKSPMNKDYTLQIPPFAELLIMKYTPSVSTEKEFGFWYWSLDVANIVICIDTILDIKDCCLLCQTFSSCPLKKCFSGFAS